MSAVKRRPDGHLTALAAEILRKLKGMRLPMDQAVYVVGEVLEPLLAQYLLDRRGSPESRAKLDRYLADLRVGAYARAGYAPPGDPDPRTATTRSIVET